MKIKENFLLFSVIIIFCISIPPIIAILLTNDPLPPKEKITYVLPFKDADCKQIAAKVSIEYDKTKLPNADTVRLYNMIHTTCLLHLANIYTDIDVPDTKKN